MGERFTLWVIDPKGRNGRRGARGVFRCDCLETSSCSDTSHRAQIEEATDFDRGAQKMPDISGLCQLFIAM